MSMHHFYYQTALVAAAVAQGRIYHEFITPSSPYGAVAGDTGDEQDRQRFAQGNLRPNISKSFNFTPFYVDGVFNTGTNSIDESNVWTLRECPAGTASTTETNHPCHRCQRQRLRPP